MCAATATATAAGSFPGPTVVSHSDHQTHSESSQSGKPSSWQVLTYERLVSSSSASISLGKAAAASSNQNRPIILRVNHPRLQPIIAFPITVCRTAPPPVSHLPKHLPFRNADTRSLETALSPNLRLPDPFDQRGVRSLFASMSRSLLIC